MRVIARLTAVATTGGSDPMARREMALTRRHSVQRAAQTIGPRRPRFAAASFQPSFGRQEPASALDGHDPAEFLVADLAISIRVRLSDHGVDLRVWDVLPHAAKGSEHLLELLLVDLA